MKIYTCNIAVVFRINAFEATTPCARRSDEMGLLEDAFKGWTGLAVGLGAAYAAPALAPAVGPIVRPLAKGLIRTGFIIVQSVREYAAEASEEIGDLYAEAQAENHRKGARELAGGKSRAPRASRASATDAPRRRRATTKRK
jgi:hypothetical protein